MYYENVPYTRAEVAGTLRTIKSLRIIGKRWTVQAAGNRLAREGGAVGRLIADTCQILYDEEQCDEQLADTLLHEALHAIDYSMAIGLEEEQVCALASGLLAFVRDNPDFIDALYEEPCCEDTPPAQHLN